MSKKDIAAVVAAMSANGRMETSMQDQADYIIGLTMYKGIVTPLPAGAILRSLVEALLCKEQRIHGAAPVYQVDLQAVADLQQILQVGHYCGAVTNPVAHYLAWVVERYADVSPACEAVARLSYSFAVGARVQGDWGEAYYAALAEVRASDAKARTSYEQSRGLVPYAESCAWAARAAAAVCRVHTATLWQGMGAVGAVVAAAAQADRLFDRSGRF